RHPRHADRRVHAPRRLRDQPVGPGRRPGRGNDARRRPFSRPGSGRTEPLAVTGRLGWRSPGDLEQDRRLPARDQKPPSRRLWHRRGKGQPTARPPRPAPPEAPPPPPPQPPPPPRQP